MTATFSRFDMADYLTSEEHIQAYLEAAVEDGDPSVIATALGDIARARNVTKLAQQVGISREGLYKALKPGGNPAFATVSKIARALGYEIAFRPVRAVAAAPLDEVAVAKPSTTAATKRTPQPSRTPAVAKPGGAAPRRGKASITM